MTVNQLIQKLQALPADQRQLEVQVWDPYAEDHMPVEQTILWGSGNSAFIEITA